MKHLAKHLHDVTTQITEIWCDASGWSRNATEVIAESTCVHCVRAAAAYGHEAYMREAALLGLAPLAVNDRMRRAIAIVRSLPFAAGEPGCWHVDEGRSKASHMLASASGNDDEVSLKIMGDNLAMTSSDAIAFARTLLEAACEVEFPGTE